MSPVGKMGEFCEENEDWSQYVERVEFFFTANGIEGEERKRAVLLTVMGPEAFGLLKRLVEPRKVARESFGSLVAIMRDHLESEPSDIVQRFRFNSRDRKPCESVALFNAELSKLAGRCNFGRVRDDMLRDRLVCGVNDELIRRRLLLERGLTYERALEIALAIETAPKDAQRTTSSVLPNRQGAMETGSHPHNGQGRYTTAPQEHENMESCCALRGSDRPNMPGCGKNVEEMGGSAGSAGVLRIKFADEDSVGLCEEERELMCGRPEELIKKFPCSKCARSFATEAALQLHMERHRPVFSNKRYKCTDCPYSADDKRTFVKHTRIHTGEKPFTCSICAKEFTQSAHCWQHMRIHNEDRPYLCTICPKTFNRLSTLRQHTRIHTGERPYTCTVCTKTFSHPQALHQHARIHTGERPYTCTVCDRTFIALSHCQQHMKIHTGAG